MPSWDYNPENLDAREDDLEARLDEALTRLRDPDAIQVPAPYTPEEWNETEGACPHVQAYGYHNWQGYYAPSCPCGARPAAPDHLTHSERVQEAGYDLDDPKGYSVP